GVLTPYPLLERCPHFRGVLTPYKRCQLDFPTSLYGGVPEFATSQGCKMPRKLGENASCTHAHILHIRMRTCAQAAKMAAPPKKRLRLLENHICSEEVGARGLTYDETSVVYSLLWNQPSLLPSPYCYTGRRATPLVGKGAKGKAVGLPLFYTASPDHPIRERDERGKEEETEIREAHPSTVQPVQPWRLRKRKVVDYIPSSPEAGIGERVRSELGYLFPPVMGKMVENHVQSRWLKQRNTG
ncbi:hypothetical protein GBAR_LOCUS931, partial [Geodia barretti]